MKLNIDISNTPSYTRSKKTKAIFEGLKLSDPIIQMTKGQQGEELVSHTKSKNANKIL